MITAISDLVGYTGGHRSVCDMLLEPAHDPTPEQSHAAPHHAERHVLEQISRARSEPASMLHAPISC